MIVLYQLREKRVQEQGTRKANCLFRFFCKKYTDILVKHLGGVSKEQDLIFSPHSFTSEDVFAVSLHQMTDKYWIFSRPWKETNG